MKVVIAAAMWNNPHILVLDEPTNYLDRDSLGALAAAIREYGGGVSFFSRRIGRTGIAAGGSAASAASLCCWLVPGLRELAARKPAAAAAAAAADCSLPGRTAGIQPLDLC